MVSAKNSKAISAALAAGTVLASLNQCMSSNEFELFRSKNKRVFS
jgi:hypothetical protein